jgi:hypothetical protein
MHPTCLISKGESLMSLLNQILLSIIASIVTGILAYIGFLRKSKIELKKEFETRFNNRKWDTYLRLSKMLFLSHTVEMKRFLVSDGLIDEDISNIESELHDERTKIQYEIMLVGSKKVVEAYVNYFDCAITSQFTKEEYYEKIIDLINLLREDLGLENSNLKYSTFDGIFYVSDSKKKKLYEARK